MVVYVQCHCLNPDKVHASCFVLTTYTYRDHYFSLVNIRDTFSVFKFKNTNIVKNSLSSANIVLLHKRLDSSRIQKRCLIISATNVRVTKRLYGVF